MSDEFKIDYTVTGRVLDQRFIEIERMMKENFERATTIHRKLIDTEEKLIREGLIRIGWTPPADQGETE